MEGRTVRLVAADPVAHAADLHAAYVADAEDRVWTYLPYGPFAALSDFRVWMEKTCTGDDPLFHTICTADGAPVGLASYLRIDPGNGAIEVGHINYAPALQRSVMATEAMFLMMSRVFDELGYRRYEWKCDALNEPSRRAALRLGFRYEGTFRQATHYKGRNRDTAWFAMTDKDWPQVRAALTRWLDAENFDAEGRQKAPLAVPRG
ncbi:MAG: GNAT family N-acetyltransferase [Limimaricola sp.]|nr:GNAT family N-acetyltransferase [Limimaricola sp.]